jgi:signal transduction histidine kinase
MATREQKPPSVERQRTDESLDAERSKTDHELSKKRTSIEEEADAVVARARNRADQVLDEARTRADEELKHASPSSGTQGIVDEERSEADRLVEVERASADEQLTQEREERRRALADLLRLEREATDTHLLTERQRSDEAVVSRDDFMGMVSHDLRTMLGGIALHASLLLKTAPEGQPGDFVRRHAQGVQRFTARVNRLVGDLLDVASIEAGRLAVTPERHDATPLVRETLDAFQPLAAERGIRLDSEIARGSLLAKFDQGRVQQVLANLVSNAIKFTPTGGRILLRVEPIGDEVRFSVRDTGPGIPPAHAEAVFRRFWQVTPGDARGLGLGLYISRCVVEAHGGRIWVESQPGEGSTFFFTLPGVVPPRAD